MQMKRKQTDDDDVQVKEMRTAAVLGNDEIKHDEYAGNPVLTAKKNRFVLFPIQFNKIWHFYKKAEASTWHAQEVDFSYDLKDWVTLKDDERFFIMHILGFFASSDGIVGENLEQNVIKQVKMLEAKYFYTHQAFMENVHAETYSKAIDVLILDPKEKNEILNSVQNHPAIRKKADWAMKWLSADVSFEERLIAFAAVEGIFFSGSFCAIFWIKKRGLMQGLTFSNELISRDEGIHCEFACLLYSLFFEKLDSKKVENIIRNAVLVETEFICESLPCALIGMNQNLMSQYIEFVADRLLVALGCDKIYNSQNPFEWMEMISMQGKTNFFEKKVGEYQKGGVMNYQANECRNLDMSFKCEVF